MKCLRCGPLIKAIDAYLAKAENDLYEQLTMEGYLKAKESLNTVDEIEEVVTKLLEDNADDLLKELADAIDLETFFKDNWPKFKNKSKLSQDLFDVFHTQFSTIMPTYVEAYVQKTDAELTVTKLTKRTTDWISSWSSDLADIMKLDTETEIEAVLKKGLNDGKGIQIAQQQPQNDMDSDIKLTLPAGTDIRLNDKIVSSETGLEYTAGQPRNIRGHHMTVKIYRTAQQRPL